MNCEEFQSQFTDLVDDRLRAPAAKTMGEHLTDCPRCREELAGLIECRRLVASLPELEPPTGLVTRVMAHVGESAKEPTYWERLFLPVKVKVPLQATAVALIAILSIYVYQREDRQTAPVVSQNSLLRPGADTIEQPSPSVQSGTAGHTEEKPVGSPGNTARPAQSPPRAKSSPARPVEERPIEPAKDIRRSVPIPAQGIIAAMGSSGPLAPREPGFGSYPGERQLYSFGEPVADYELVVSPRRKPHDARGQESDAQEKRAESENSSTTEPKPRANAQYGSILDVLWYTIPQDRYERFKSELAAQATIESEVSIGAKDKQSSFNSDGPFYVKVIVVSPAER